MLSKIEVSQVGDCVVVDSRLIADHLGIEHASLLKTIDRHLERLQTKSPIRFKVDVVKRPQGGTYNLRYALLDERQATLLMTYSRNTEQVLNCKDALVDAFQKAKQIIPQQSEEIERLKMQLEIMQRQDNRIALHGIATALMLEGKSNAVVEIEKPTIEVIDKSHNVRFEGQTLTQVKDFIEKKTGKRFKTGADIKHHLEKMGMGGLIGQTKRSVLSDYIPKENLEAVYDALMQGNYQLLLGE